MLHAAPPMNINSSAPAVSAARTTVLGLLQESTRNAAASGISSTNTRIMRSTPQSPQFGNVQVLERVANAKGKKSHQEHSHQQVKHHPDLNDQWHAERSSQRGQEDAVIQHQQPYHLHEGFFAAYHEKSAGQNQSHRGCQHGFIHTQSARIGLHGKKGEKDQPGGNKMDCAEVVEEE